MSTSSSASQPLSTADRNPQQVKTKLRDEAPRLDSAESINRVNEQILDGLNTGALSPKTGEQMNATVKAIVKLNFDIPLKVMTLVAKYRGKVQVPRQPMLRTMLGLGPKPEPTDAKRLEEGACR